MTTELKTIENHVLAMNNDTPLDDVLELMQRLNYAEAFVRELKKQFTPAFIEWIDANGEPTNGDKRYYVGKAKRIKPRDLPALTEAVMQATGGDFERFCDALSANAFKPGHLKTVLGDAWSEHFDVEEVKNLKTGKPKREVKCFDKRFVK